MEDTKCHLNTVFSLLKKKMLPQVLWALDRHFILSKMLGTLVLSLQVEGHSQWQNNEDGERDELMEQ